jgi:hypothetical protein
MAKVKINLKAFMDAHVRPLANAADDAIPQPLPRPNVAAYDALMSLLGGPLDTTIEVDLPEVSLPPPPPSPGSGTAVTAPLPLQPIDPVKALEDIAKAVRQAERTLLGENLSIHNASVDVNLLVNVGNVAGASANLNLKIGPVPTD